MKIANGISLFLAFTLVMATLLYSPIANAQAMHDCCDQLSAMDECGSHHENMKSDGSAKTGKSSGVACDLNCCGMIMSVATLLSEAGELVSLPQFMKWTIPAMSQKVFVTSRIQPRPPKPLM